ncbi:MAG TPA: hypothetical protein VM939_03460, partial [Gemmatimonadaceae bacterium]|nr:hypothetical protein [Gemmatimonadaceae bacterium]
MTKLPLFLIGLAASIGTATPLAAQLPTQTPILTAAGDLLRTCSELAENKKPTEAVGSGKRAEAAFRSIIATDPSNLDAVVGLARVLSQCLLPSAELARQGELSGQAMELLDQVLAVNPRHWTARFVLASINYRSPSFLRRSGEAARHFDELLKIQGDRADVPQFARVYEYRGMLFKRASKTDSAIMVWQRGVSLFPSDSALKALTQSTATAPSATTPIQTSPGSSTSAPPTTRDSAKATAGLATMVIVASSRPPTATLPSQQNLTATQVLMAPGASADVFQAVQLQPGATRVNEGSDVYTRGGDASETPLIVNGGRLLSLTRFEGLSGGMFGALDPFVVKSVRHSTGGFSAKYGNALSGILEIETDGKPRERELRAGVSLVQLSGSAHLPIGPTAGGWISARAQNTRALLATHGRSTEFDGAPHSEEVSASFISTPTSLSEVRATVLLEQDDSRRIISSAGWTGPFHATSTNRAIVLSGRWISSSSPLTIRGSIAGSAKSSAWNFGILDRDRSERSLMNRVDADWTATPVWTLRAGVEQGMFDRNEDGTLPTTPIVAPGSPVRTVIGTRSTASRSGAYAESEINVRGATVTLGLRADKLPGEQSFAFDPRVAVASTHGEWTARLSGGVFHQGSWRADASIPDAGKPSGVATKATHLVAGIERNGATTTLRAEAFHKRYSNFVELGSGPRAVGGLTRGLDLIAQRTSGGRVTGWLGYSLLDGKLDLTGGRRVRSPFDVTHTVTGS